MIKSIVKMFLSGEKLAKYAADGIQKGINNSGKSEVIAKYGNMADEFTEIQKWITDTLKDGQISDEEKKQIQEKLVPVFEKLVKMI